MTTLKSEKRDLSVKAKKLRREGFTTGVLFGKEMEESIPLQFSEVDALRFIKSSSKGSQVTLELGNEKISAILKSMDYNPMNKQIMALDFQALVKGEKISTTVPIKLENQDTAQGIVEQELNEIHYKADPANLLDTIVIDIQTLDPSVKSLSVKDLNLTKGKDIQLVTPEDALVFHIADYVAVDLGESEDATEEEVAVTE